jgi:hypothetical protein
MAESVPWPELRLASRTDGDTLARFSCGDEVWQLDVERFVRHEGLPRHLGLQEPGHRLLVAEVEGELIGVAAHGQRRIQLLNEGSIKGAVAVVVALAATHHGSHIEGGPKLSHYLVAELINDMRATTTAELAYAIVDFRNRPSIALLDRFNFEEVPEGAVSGTAGVFIARLDEASAVSQALLNQ